MKILILGSGWMGSAVAYDIERFGDGIQIGLADRDSAQLESVVSGLRSDVKIEEVDCEDEESVARLFSNYDIAVSAVPYRFNAKLTAIAVDTHTHLIDLGGNSDVVREQLKQHEHASRRGVLIIPNCGLAPGLSNILAMTGFRRFDTVTSIQARVGGLPQHPRPPLKYQLVFSVEGLLNEYLEQAEIIDAGIRKRIPSMTGLEPVSFGDEFPELEAFYTAGGLSLLPELLEGKVDHLSYKTIRYQGHCEKFRTLFDIGFASSEPVMIGGGVHTGRELFAELLKKKLSGSDRDIVFFRVEVSGINDGNRHVLRYEMIDRYDTENKMTAMMRATAYPTSVIALMLARGDLSEAGVFLPEQIIDGEILVDELNRRSMKIIGEGGTITRGQYVN
jgi:lysine 6-dehydrogenase